MSLSVILILCLCHFVLYLCVFTRELGNLTSTESQEETVYSANEGRQHDTSKGRVYCAQEGRQDDTRKGLVHCEQEGRRDDSVSVQQSSADQIAGAQVINTYYF